MKTWFNLRLCCGALVLLAPGANAQSLSLLNAPRVGPAANSTMPPAPGTITTPMTPTVPRGPMPGQSTITIPGVSRSATPSTVNPASLRPCGGGASAAGAIRGNAGIAIVPSANADDSGLGIPPIIEGTNRRAPTTLNPSIRPGVPGSC